MQGIPGFPKIYGFRTEGDYNILVMQLLGKSLEKKLKSCNDKFSIATTFVLADQMV